MLRVPGDQTGNLDRSACVVFSSGATPREGGYHHAVNEAESQTGYVYFKIHSNYLTML